MGGEAQLLSDAHRGQLHAGSGWQYLLPPAPFDRLLCYDSLDGATLMLAARLAREVLVVHHAPAELARLEAVATETGLDCVRFAALTDDSLSRTRGFDGALVHDPEGRLLRADSGTGNTVGAVCARLSASLRPGGFLFLGFPNRFAYTRLRGGERGGSPGNLSPGAAIRAVRRAGLAPQPPHPFLMEYGRLTELVPLGGYRSAKNRFLPSERVREALLRGWGRRHLAPAYALLGFSGASERSWLDRLLTDPWVQSLAPRCTLHRCLLLNEGKVAASVGPTRAAHGTLVLFVTPDSVAMEWRRAEGQWLRRLGQLPREISGAVPVFHGEREINGVRVFALSERPGVTVDHDAPFMDELTATAAEWLRGLHLTTARPMEITAATFEDLFDKAQARNPRLAAEITALEKEVRRHLVGRVLRLAWMHGDFKLENVVFDERSRALQGVIDWELAWKYGPPLVDLLYLLLYNRVVRARDAFTGMMPAFEAAVLRQEWTRDERTHLDAHNAALGSPRDLEAAMGALFFVHHIGFRLTDDLSNEATVAELRPTLSALRRRLAECPS